MLTLKDSVDLKPLDNLHVTPVSEFHTLDSQVVRPIDANGLMVYEPKLSPSIGICCPPVLRILKGTEEVTLGGRNVNANVSVCTDRPTVKAIDN
jgi:hypothetical protein